MPELLPWHHLPPSDIFLAYQTTANGLPAEGIEQRLQTYGANKFSRERPTSAFKILWRQVSSPLMVVLTLAVGLSLGLGHVIDSLLTFLVMLINILMGFIQEYKADRSLLALRHYLPALALVRRSGKIMRVSVEDIVPGDIMLLSTGDKVTADARVFVTHSLATDEAALTGESQEVNKTVAPVAADAGVAERTSMVFAGTVVVAGKGEAVVVATGRQTEFGKITQLVIAPVPETTPLQDELLRLARSLVGIMLAAAIGVFVLGAIRGISVVEMLSTSAALAVAAVPEGLLIGVTMILTVGMSRMLKRQALVQRLLAAETLGSVEILCVDKTGTLTTGRMTVTEVRSGTDLVFAEHAQPATQQFLRDVFMVTSAHLELSAHGVSRINGSPTETGILEFLMEHHIHLSDIQATVLQDLPFDSAQKFSAKLIREHDQNRSLVLGAPDVLLARCAMDSVTRQDYQATLDDMIARGLRVVLLAGKTVITDTLDTAALTDLVPIGLLGLRDPLRPNAAQTIRDAQAAGMRVMMITGDHPGTAAAVATELGLVADAEHILSGQELAGLNAGALMERLRTVTICARVQPEQKLRIVTALQALGYAVAMTGDGVNDAPALRAADIGVAVGSGTEVAKDTADMVILDNNVKSIIAAVREGRIIFDNIRKLVAYLLTFSLSEVALIAGVLLLGMPVPFAPLHILWINLITDGFPSLALAFEKGEVAIMQEAPRRRHEPIIPQGLRKLMIFSGAVAVAGLLLLYVALYHFDYDLTMIRTMLWLLLGLDSLFAIYPLRSLRQPFWKLPARQNPVLLVALGVGIILLTMPIILPEARAVFGLAKPNLQELSLVVGMVAVKIFVIELGKAWFLFDVRKPRAVVS